MPNRMAHHEKAAESRKPRPCERSRLCDSDLMNHFSFAMRRLRLIAIGLVIPLSAGCRSPESTSIQPFQRFEFQSSHMGTLFTITLYASEKSIAQNAALSAFQRVALLDETMSDYRADSELMRLCEEPRTARSRER